MTLTVDGVTEQAIKASFVCTDIRLVGTDPGDVQPVLDQLKRPAGGPAWPPASSGAVTTPPPREPRVRWLLGACWSALGASLWTGDATAVRPASGTERSATGAFMR